MTTKLKNKINKKTGNFICKRCGKDVDLGVVIRGYAYCIKCADIIKGIRVENGMRV